MNPSSNSCLVSAGTRIELIAPKGKRGFWQRALGNVVIAGVNSWLNLKVKVLLTTPLASGGTTTSTIDCPLLIAEGGSTLTIPLTQATTTSGGTANVPYSGAGPPTSSTLAAGNYVASPIPSLYVDMTARVLYVCVTPGTNATSVWAQISTGIAGPAVWL